MPAFAQSAGGMLTDKQIEALMRGIFRAGGASKFSTQRIHPPTRQKPPGMSIKGRWFRTYCASCHGSEGGGGTKGSAITNDSFLALVSDQGLRTVVITGRPELGAPDWRGNVPGSRCQNRKSQT